jgi:Ni,Fe-hydrogenase III large subunit
MRPLRNAEAVALAAVPVVEAARLADVVGAAIDAGGRLAALFGRPHAGATRVTAVLADDAGGTLAVTAADVRDAYPALTPRWPQADRFEAELAEQCGVRPLGHPGPRPVRAVEPSSAPFFALGGDAVHEVAVGPVHAGVIEPGHFRFQCLSETVLHLEIALGYQHRGVERALVGGPGKRTIHQVETIAGDTTVGHALAYSQAVEALAGCRVPARAEALRGVALELERLANHTGDLGALAGDVGYLPTAAYCGRLRGELLNLTALVCGSRLGRGLVRPGGVGFDVDAPRTAEIRDRLGRALDDVREAVALLWDEPSVQARFEDVGTLPPETCEALGVVGPAARACGVARDVRHQFPTGIFRFAQVPVSTWHSGDVFARAQVRWLEIQRSAAFVEDQLRALPDGPVRTALPALRPEAFVVSLVEAWRGEVCHVATTDARGAFARYKVVDPSFHNWPALAIVLRGQQISDFPLCNKSFNLSYCGHDL